MHLNNTTMITIRTFGIHVMQQHNFCRHVIGFLFVLFLFLLLLSSLLLRGLLLNPTFRIRSNRLSKHHHDQHYYYY